MMMEQTTTTAEQTEYRELAEDTTPNYQVLALAIALQALEDARQTWDHAEATQARRWLAQHTEREGMVIIAPFDGSPLHWNGDGTVSSSSEAASWCHAG
jgi:hypothetical protein